MNSKRQDIKISVIIPVYNTAKYLKACIDSVLNQTLKELEIILVDDGSEDDCWKIIQDYADNYSNIIALQQNRKRQGAARNLALTYASGEYIAFLDSDDTIPESAYDRMYLLAQEHGTDMVAGILQSFNRTRRWRGVLVHSQKFQSVCGVTNIFSMPELLTDTSACNRIIKKSAIDKYKIGFSEKVSGEDLDFMARLYLRLKKISILPEVVYNYRARPGASSIRINPSFFRDRAWVTTDLEKYYEKHNGMSVFPYLLRSEVSKLVANRFARVINELQYEKQVEVFDYIHSLVIKLSENDIINSETYIERARTRIIFLRFKEYDALIAFEKQPFGGRFFSIIQNEKCKALLAEPLLQIYRLELKNSSSPGMVNFLIQKARKVKRVLQLITRANVSKLFAIIKYIIVYYLYYIPFHRKKDDQKVWLIDERMSQSAEDNAFHLFSYIRGHDPKFKIYYVINRHSKQKQYVAPLGNVVNQFSWKHIYLLCQSSVLLSTDSFKSIACPYEVFSFLRQKKHNVFLQHGVAGNKQMTYYQERYPYFSQVITSNENERNFFINTYHFNKEVIVTGLARFDALPLEKRSAPKKTILVASTWRKWLKGDKSINSSKYYAAWNRLITSPKLESLLSKYGVTLYFQPHFNMMKFIKEFESLSDHIRIIQNLDKPLQEMIINCDVLITDYSSVMYDFYYQKKPVICYMFDKNEWELQPDGPPHIDFEKDLPADITHTVDELLNALEYYFKNNFEMKPMNENRINSFFKYRDHHNCDRIFNSVCQAAGKNNLRK